MHPFQTDIREAWYTRNDKIMHTTELVFMGDPQVHCADIFIHLADWCQDQHLLALHQCSLAEWVSSFCKWRIFFCIHRRLLHALVFYDRKELMRWSQVRYICLCLAFLWIFLCMWVHSAPPQDISQHCSTANTYTYTYVRTMKQDVLVIGVILFSSLHI